MFNHSNFIMVVKDEVTQKKMHADDEELAHVSVL